MPAAQARVDLQAIPRTYGHVDRDPTACSSSTSGDESGTGSREPGPEMLTSPDQLRPNNFANHLPGATPYVPYVYHEIDNRTYVELRQARKEAIPSVSADFGHGRSGILAAFPEDSNGNLGLHRSL